jgi:pimeloyl-ACP methyl ester carboxylesterase/putative sterol carrier protein
LSLPKRFRSASADGLRAEWELTVGQDVYTISVVDRKCFAREGPSSAPVARLTADPATWLAIDDGDLWGIEAVLARRLVVEGSLDLGARLQTLFVPHARRRGPVDLEQLTVDAGGTALSSYVAGRGAPVILLHGLGASKVSLMPLIPALVHAGHRVVVPDLPGHGASDKPRTDYTPRFYARVIRRLMDALEIDRAAVVGNSLGGRVALEVGIRSPGHVSGLVLLDPAVPGFRVRYLLGFTRVIPSEIGTIPFPLRERWMRLAIRRLLADPSRLPQAGIHAAAEEFIRIYSQPIARMAFLDSLRHILTEPPRPFWGRIRRIRVPALVVWGEDDRLVPVRLAHRLARELPRAELLVLPRVGHVPQFEAPEETSGAILRFLMSLPN